MISIQTERLTLIPLDHSLLECWFKFGRNALELNLQLNPNVFQLEVFYENEMQHALEHYWIPMTKKFPFDFMWYTNWEIILTNKSCSIGGIGFSGMPDDQGSTEIGYAIDPKYRGNGYAKEAVKGMIDWAFQDLDLQFIRAETPCENLGSQSVLLANQFQQVGRKTIYCPEALDVFTWERHR